MMFTLRVASRNLLRTTIPTRALSITSVSRADIVTDLYLKSLRDFKPTPSKASDSEGQVKAWSAPAPPQAPESASNVESELSAYESSEVESASSGASATSSSESDGDWFELDTSPDHAHH